MWGAEEMQRLEKRTLPDGKKTKNKKQKKTKTNKQKKTEGRFLTKEGSSPEWYKPNVGFWSG